MMRDDISPLRLLLGGVVFAACMVGWLYAAAILEAVLLP